MGKPRGGAIAREEADDPHVREIRDHRLNMEVVQKYIRAAKTGMSDPATRKCFENNPPEMLLRWIPERSSSAPAGRPPAS